MASLPRKLLLLNMFAHQASHVASIMAPGEAQARQFHLPFLRTETYSGNGPRNQLPWTRRNIYSKVSTLLQTVFKTAFFINFIYCIYLLPYSKKKSGAYWDLFLVIAEKAWFFSHVDTVKNKKDRLPCLCNICPEKCQKCTASFPGSGETQQSRKWVK